MVPNDAKPHEKKPDAHIFNARILLFCMAALQAYTLISIFSQADSGMILKQVILIVTSISLAIWTKYNPLIALPVALVLWIVAYIVDLRRNGFNFDFSLLLFVVVFTLLALGLRNAISLKK